ncbi:MAG: hypothetical protein ACTHLH_00195 [Solirubrobacterales bacterium]
MAPDAVAQVGLVDPGREIDSEALREVYFGLRRAAEEISGPLATEWGIEVESEISVAVAVELPDQYAAPLAKVIETLDLFWRLAWMATELRESELPSSGGTTDLEILLPASECGLLIERMEIGSLKVWFKEHETAIRFTAALLSAIATLGSSGIKAVSVAADQPPRDVPPRLIKQLDEASARVLKENSAGIPPNSTFKVTTHLPDGTYIEAEVHRGSS